MPHQVTGVEIDPDNHVLDGVAEGKKSAREAAPLFSLSPNPNRGSFSFRMRDLAGMEPVDRVTLEIYSTSGQLVQQEHYQGCLPYLDYPVRLQDPARGLYYARFRCGTRVEMLKILVE
jgi:hypothetical protein